MQSFWKWLARRSAKYAGIPLRDPALVALFGDQPSEAGVDVTEMTALNCSAVWAAVNVISQTVASLPVLTYRLDGDTGRLYDYEHPVHRLMQDEPNPEMTPMQFFETLQAHALTWGNGYAEIEWDGSMPVALWPITPDRVIPMREDDAARTLYYEVLDDNHSEPRRMKPGDVLHVPGLSFDGNKGYSVVRQARECLGLCLATERYGASFFGRGSMPGGVLKHPGELKEPAKKNLRESWSMLHQGPANAHRVAILDEGMTWEAVGLPPEDSQFLQTRLFQISEVARWFNIPPHLLRDLTHATFSNIEHQGLDFLIYTLRPWLVRWQQEIRRKLFALPERRTYRVDHKVSDILKADTVARYNAYKVGRDGGWLTLNDILRAEDMDTIDGVEGDQRLMPANMLVMGAKAEGKAEEAALNGAQVSSLLTILQSVASGALKSGAARPLILISFPAVSEAHVDEMLAEYVSTDDEEPPPPEEAIPAAFPVDQLQATLELMKGITPVSWDLAREMLKAVYPVASDAFLDALLAKLSIDGIVVAGGSRADCGTGHGGFKGGNDCAEGYGRPNKDPKVAADKYAETAKKKAGKDAEELEKEAKVAQAEADRLAAEAEKKKAEAEAAETAKAKAEAEAAKKAEAEAQKAADEAKKAADEAADKEAVGRETPKFGRQFANMKEADAYMLDAYKADTRFLGGEFRTAAKSYQDIGYLAINEHLRGGGKATAKEWDDVDLDDVGGARSPDIYTRRLDHVIGRGELPDDMTLYRTVDTATFDKLTSSSEFSDKGYVSTTMNPQGSAFASEEGKDTIIEIRAKKGSKSMFLEAATGEKTGESEILLPRGSKFKVVSVTKSGNNRRAVVELL